MLGRLFQTLTKWILAFTLALAIVVIVFAKAMMHILRCEFDAGWIVLVIGPVDKLRYGFSRFHATHVRQSKPTE